MTTIIAEATAAYNQHTKRWDVLNGKLIATFPPGPEGKRMAQLEAMEINRPDLAALVHRVASNSQDPKALNMALKAAQILDAGLLYINGVCHSQSRAGIIHTVTYDGRPKTYHCSCEAFSFCPVYINDVGFLCKHCLADYWTWLLGLDLEQQPIPFNGETTPAQEFDGETSADWDPETEINF